MNSVTHTFLVKLQNLGDIRIGLNRAWAPRTVQAINDNLPLHARGMKFNNSLSIPVNLSVPPENARRSFQPYEIAFDPANDTLVICLGQVNWDRPMNYIGFVLDDESKAILEKITMSVAITITPE